MNVPTLSFDAFAAKYCERQENTPDGLHKIFTKQEELYHPAGWVMMQCEDFSSSRLGSLAILPVGPNNTWKEIPDHPMSPRGLSSDMSVAVAWLPAEVFKAFKLTASKP